MVLISPSHYRVTKGKYRGTTRRRPKKGRISQYPKYVRRYFPQNEPLPLSRVQRRFKELDNSRWGYKSNEYKDLRRFLRTQRR